METRNAKEYASWYASYMDDDQGKSLIECLSLKVKQQEDLINRLSGEIELSENPKEETAETIINSLKGIIEQKEEIKVTRGYFSWVI